MSRLPNATKREAGQEALSKIQTTFEFCLVTCAKDTEEEA